MGGDERRNGHTPRTYPKAEVETVFVADDGSEIPISRIPLWHQGRLEKLLRN
jgi:hypothetical protein